MSRTHRKYESHYLHAHGKFFTWDECHFIIKADVKRLGLKHLYFCEHECHGWTSISLVEKQRDRKPWGKPPKWFKQVYRRRERAKVNDAMRNEKEIPFFKRSDGWNWT